MRDSPHPWRRPAAKRTRASLRLLRLMLPQRKTEALDRAVETLANRNPKNVNLLPLLQDVLHSNLFPKQLLRIRNPLGNILAAYRNLKKLRLFLANGREPRLGVNIGPHVNNLR